MLRNPETKYIIRYVIGLHAMAMSVDELFNLMRNKMPIAKPHRFQIGVKILKDDKTFIRWHEKIYTFGTVHNGYIYNLDGEVYEFTDKDVVLTTDYYNIFANHKFKELITKSK